MLEPRSAENLRLFLREALKNVLMAVPGTSALRVRLGGGRTTGGYRVEEARRRLQTAWETLEPALPDLRGRAVLEIGPGAHLGLCLLCLGKGASRVAAVDRFPELTGGEREQRLYGSIPELLPDWVQDALAVGRGERAGRMAFHPVALEDLGTSERYDLALSYHSLQHVWNLPRALRALRRHLVPGAVTVHAIDLRALGNVDPDGSEPLRHLEFHRWLWWLMGSSRGLPNRLRPGQFVRHFEDAGFRDVHWRPLRTLPAGTVERVRPFLRPCYRAMPASELEPAEILLTAVRP